MPKMLEHLILLVEDDKGHARLLERTLYRAGVSNGILIIDDGQEALDYLLKQGAYGDAQHPLPLLVLLDMQLPTLDGIQVLERLKANDYTKDVPILMMSSTESIEEMEQCARLGCTVQLVKPIDSTAFFEAVHHLSVCITVDVAG